MVIIIKIDYMSKQVYILSIIGLLTSIISGFGLIFIIPVLTQCINIKVNYVSYSKETIDKTIVYCLAGIVLSIMMILISNKLIPNL